MKAHQSLLALACALASSCAHSDNSPQILSLAGHYDGSRHEMFAGLHLDENGTYHFAMSVGALDLRSQGSWTQRGDTILFETEPSPVAPAFVPEEGTAREDKPWITVSWPNGEAIQNIRVELECDDGKFIRGLTDHEGWSPAEGECENPVSARLIEDIYDVESPVFTLAPASNDRPPNYRFVLEPNDLGILDLTGATATLVGGELVLVTKKGELSFSRVASR